MKTKYICGLDIGTTKVAASIGRIGKGGKIEQIEVGSSPSRGVQGGLVNDLDSLNQSIREAIAEVQEKIKIKVHSVIANINGKHIKGFTSRGAVPVLERGGEVTKRDLEKVKVAAQTGAISLDREILLQIPKSYCLDNQYGINNPIGLYGSKLEIELYVVTGSTRLIQNAVKFVNQAGFEVEELILTGLASSYAVSTEDEREVGVTVIDIGADTTNVAVFFDGTLREIEIMNWGGNYLTKSIAETLKIPLNLAEELKINHSSVLPLNIKEDEVVMIKRGSSYRTISRSSINLAVEPKVKKALNLIKNRLAKSGWLNKVSSGVVITGGTSLMDGLLEFSEEIFGIPTRLGTIREVESLVLNSPIYAVSVGLVKYLTGRYSSQSLCPLGRNIVAKVIVKAKELFTDYF